jgi:hypothetical protein
MWASPIKQPKPPKEKIEVIKKPKQLISKGTARAIVKHPVDSLGAKWIENWIEQCIRENSYPPQLLSDDFIPLLSKFFSPEKALQILEKIRSDYMSAHSWNKSSTEEEGFDFLLNALAQDKEAQDFLKYL